jgi:hypothetical protein
MIFNVETIREHRQPRLPVVDINIISRGVATLNNVTQVSVVVSQWVIIHWKPPSYNQINKDADEIFGEGRCATRTHGRVPHYIAMSD